VTALVASPQASAVPGRRAVGLLTRIAQRWSVFVVAVLGWELAARAAGSAYFPPPTTIAANLRDNWLGGTAGQLFLSDLACCPAWPGCSGRG